MTGDVRIGDVWRDKRLQPQQFPRGRVDVVDVVEIQGTLVVFFLPLTSKDAIRLPAVDFESRYELRVREGQKPVEPPHEKGPESVHGMERVGRLDAARKPVDKLFEQPFEYDKSAERKGHEHAKATKQQEHERREQRSAEPVAGPALTDNDLPF